MVLTNSSLRKGVLSMLVCLVLFFTVLAQDQHTLSKKEMKELSRVFEGEFLVNEVILADFSTSTGQILREGDLLFKITEENETPGICIIH